MDIRESSIEHQDHISRHPWELARRQFVARICEQIVSTFGSTCFRVLDVGCGDLFVTQYLAAKYARLDFIGIDKAFVKCSVDMFETQNLHLHHDLSYLKVVSSLPVGLILLLDVLEHTAAEESFLKLIIDHERTSPDCWVLITAPAFNSLYCSHDKLLDHYRRYSLRQIETIASNAGLKVIRSGYRFCLPLCLRLFRVIMERLGILTPLTKTEASQWKGGPFITQLTCKLLHADITLSAILEEWGLRLPGLSCFLVCRKINNH